jgi:RNA polymerase sigma-70 factor (ECF subfamily)
MSDWRLPRDPLLALREGDTGPFETFVTTQSRTLIAFFRSRGAALTRAEDLAQEVFVRLFRHAARYRPEQRFVAYCFRIARNVRIDDLRRAGTRPEPEAAGSDDEASGEEPVAPPVDPLARLASQEAEQRLRRLVELLPDGQRSVFELAVLGELSYGEVSSILEIPVGTVKSRMFHAVRRLREALAAGEEAR